MKLTGETELGEAQGDDADEPTAGVPPLRANLESQATQWARADTVIRFPSKVHNSTRMDAAGCVRPRLCPCCCDSRHKTKQRLEDEIVPLSVSETRTRRSGLHSAGAGKHAVLPSPRWRRLSGLPPPSPSPSRALPSAPRFTPRCRFPASHRSPAAEHAAPASAAPPRTSPPLLPPPPRTAAR